MDLLVYSSTMHVSKSSCVHVSSNWYTCNYITWHSQAHSIFMWSMPEGLQSDQKTSTLTHIIIQYIIFAGEQNLPSPCSQLSFIIQKHFVESIPMWYRGHVLSNLAAIYCFLPQHQCRICWDVVCDACSKHKIPISDPSSKPERVCDECFNKLSATNVKWKWKLAFIRRRKTIVM